MLLSAFTSDISLSLFPSLSPSLPCSSGSGDLICIFVYYLSAQDSLPPLRSCCVSLRNFYFLLLPPPSAGPTLLLRNGIRLTKCEEDKKLLIKNSCRAFNFVPKGMKVQNCYILILLSARRCRLGLETLMVEREARAERRIP
jgi:hypothetical protein